MTWRLNPGFLMSLLTAADVSTNSKGDVVLRSCHCTERDKEEFGCKCHPSVVTYIKLSSQHLGLIVRSKLKLHPARSDDIQLLWVHQKLIALRNVCLRVVAKLDKELKTIDDNPSAYNVTYGKSTLKTCKNILREK